MKEQKEIIRYLKNVQDPYQIQVEDIVVNMKYSESNIKFNNCMRNILIRKVNN